MTKQELKLAILNNELDLLVSQEIDRRIRQKYTQSAEFAILRQQKEKPEEYAAYYAYCEECKKQVKAEIYGEQ